MATCKPPPHELDAFEACAARSDRRRLAPSGGGKPGESGGGKPVPIVGVSVVGRHASAGFDHAAAETFLANLDARLDGRATALLAQNGVTDLVDAAYKLSCTLPKVISIPFDPSASRNVLRGTITDIAEAMSHARTLPLPDKDTWHTSRVADQDVLGQADQ